MTWQFVNVAVLEIYFRSVSVTVLLARLEFHTIRIEGKWFVQSREPTKEILRKQHFCQDAGKAAFRLAKSLEISVFSASCASAI